MFCPQCGEEYREGFTVCADCDVALVGTPPPALEDDDPHLLVPVFESSDREMLGAALARLRAMEVPHLDPGPIPDASRSVRSGFDIPILVALSRSEEALRCLTGVREGVEACRRELERHGFDDRTADEEASGTRVLYCGRCGSAHFGFTRCVDCGLPLQAELPEHAEAEPRAVFATLDEEALAAARSCLIKAGVPFDWGGLSQREPLRQGEPAPSRLVAAGWIQVPAARELEARHLLAMLPNVHVPKVPRVGASPIRAAAEPVPQASDELDALEDGEDEDLPSGGEEGILYCPRCREEYRAGFSRCVDCDVALVADLPPPNDPVQWTPQDLGDAANRCMSCGAPLPGAHSACPSCSPPDEDEAPAAGHTVDMAAPPPAVWWAVAAGLPQARADHERIVALHSKARLLAGVGVVILPWMTEIAAFRNADRALALIHSYGAAGHPLERQIQRLRTFSLAYLAASWLTLAIWLIRLARF